MNLLYYGILVVFCSLVPGPPETGKMKIEDCG